MRIAHVNLLVRPTIGVEKKLAAQSTALDELGIDDFDIYVLNTRIDDRVGRLRYVRVPSRSPMDRLRLGISRFDVIRTAADWSPYDVLILRYPFADRGAPRFAAHFPVVSEHHTKEIEERRALLGSPLPFSHRAFLHLSLHMERKEGPRFLRHTSGIIGISDEVRRYELRRAGVAKPSLSLPNGVAVNEVPLTGFAPFDGKELKMVITATNARPWHGVDRLVRSLAADKGRTAIACHIVGDANRSSIPRLPDHVRIDLHGTLRGPDLDRLMARMNLAVSSLALFRNAMQEGSPLKTREYTARGLPFVLGYDDPDLRAAGAAAFSHQVPADESLLPMDEIIEFSSEVSTKNDAASLSTRMRDYAARHMDWRIKLSQMVRFLESL